MKNKSGIQTASIIALLLLIITLAAIYVSNINFRGDFQVKVYHDKQNISAQVDAFGVSFFNRKQELIKRNEFSENTDRWYFRHIHITIPDSISINTEKVQIIIANESGEHIIPFTQINNQTLQINKNLHDNWLWKISILLAKTGPLLIILLVLLLLPRTLYLTNFAIPKTYLNIATVTVFVILCANIIFLSQYLFPPAEDLQITHTLREASNPMLHFYKNVDGRYFTNLLFAVANPLFYGLPIWTYKLVPYPVFIMLFISINYLIKTINTQQKNSFYISCFLICTYLIFIPAITPSLFYMGASYHYTVLVILASFLFAQTYKYIKKPNLRNAILTALLITTMHGINAFSFMITSPILLILLIQTLYFDKKNYKFLLIIFFVSIITALIVILSPGNITKLNNYASSDLGIGYEHNFLSAVFYSFFANLKVFTSYIINYPIIIFLVLIIFTFSGLYFKTQLFQRLKMWQLITIFLFINLWIIFLFPLPYYYAGLIGWSDGSYHGLRFYHNCSSFLIILTNFLLLNELAVRLHSLSDRLKILFFKNKIFAFIFIILFLFSFSNSYTLFSETISDIRKGVLPEYYKEVKSRHEKFCSSKYNCTVVIEKLKNRPSTIINFNDYFNKNQLIVFETFNEYRNREFILINTRGDTLRNMTFLPNKITEMSTRISELIPHENYLRTTNIPVHILHILKSNKLIIDYYISENSFIILLDSWFCMCDDENKLKLNITGISVSNLKNKYLTYNIYISGNNEFIKRDSIFTDSAIINNHGFLNYETILFEDISSPELNIEIEELINNSELVIDSLLLIKKEF